jgi:hypothetical protein
MTFGAMMNLQTEIKLAWETCIQSDYETLRINSERSLQASFWAQLNSRLLPKDDWLMFIEPGLKVKGEGKVFPDIVICDTEKAVAVIELKYQPRKEPDWKKDIGTLDWIHRHRKKLHFQNVRHDHRPEKVKEYTLSDNLLFVWAGVHLSMSNEFEELLIN